MARRSKPPVEEHPEFISGERALRRKLTRIVDLEMANRILGFVGDERNGMLSNGGLCARLAEDADEEGNELGLLARKWLNKMPGWFGAAAIGQAQFVIADHERRKERNQGASGSDC